MGSVNNFFGKEATLFFSFHLNRYAIFSLSLAFFHQLCIGFSVVALVFLSENIANGSEGYRAWFYAYLFFMVFPYFPGVLSQYYLGMWGNDLYVKFVKSSVESAPSMGADHRGWMQEYKDRRLRSSFDIFFESTEYSHQLITSILNAGFTIAVLAMLLDGSIFIGLLMTVTLSFFIIRRSRRALATSSKLRQKQRIRLLGKLENGLENYVFGGALNRSMWNDLFCGQVTQYDKSVRRNLRYSQAGLLAISVAAVLPMAAILFLMVHRSQGNYVALAAIAVSLTRIFHVLSGVTSIFFQIFEWGSLRGRISTLLPRSGTVISRDPDYAMVRVASGNQRYSVDEFLNMKFNPGRFSVRGPNGSGKTTLLLEIKKRYPSRSVYVSPSQELSWPSELTAKLSSGQKSMAIITSLCLLSEDIILLDEWDAYLDAEKTINADAVIRDLAYKKTIIEVSQERR